MQIIILGANPVGTALAENLAIEKNSVTLIDHDGSELETLRERLDIRTVVGHPSNPEVLLQAQADSTEMLLAVTDTDEVNMVACRVADKLFHIPTRICRLRASGYLKHPELFQYEDRHGEIIIHPEQLITDAIVKLLDFPGTLQITEFANGKVVLAALEVEKNTPLCDQQLKTLPDHCPPDVDGRVAALFRKNRPIIPQGDTTIQSGDEVFFIAARKCIKPLISALHAPPQPVKRIMLAGGGNIGYRLAMAVEKKYHVTIIEPSLQRCNYLSAHLNHSLIIHGSATDQQLLLQQQIHSTDLFCALTNFDAINMMSSMLAVQEGAVNVISLINEQSFVELAHDNKIQIALSPRQFTISSILSHIRRGEVTAAASLRRGAAEVMEIVLHGRVNKSRIIGHRIDELKLPDSVTVGVIIRGEEVIVAHRYTVLKDNDHIILFIADKRQSLKVETMFEASFDHF